MDKLIEMLLKAPTMLFSLAKGLFGLIRGEGNEEAAKKVGKLLAVCFVSICAVNTAAAILKAKKNGHWKK